MIVIRTIPQITHAQAIAFEIAQNIRGVAKSYNAMLSTDDCIWELQVTSPKFENGFSAIVKWFQLQPYEPIEGSGTTEYMHKEIFTENFKLSKTEMKDMFDTIGQNIMAGTDDPYDKWMYITTLGVIHWCGNVRQIFGLNTSGFEVVQ